MKRRCLLAALLLSQLAAWAASAPWPDRPIRIVVPYAAGGATDQTARIAARALQKALYQPVTVENRTGGGGAVATELVKKAPADGYTLLFATSSSLASSLVNKDAGFDPVEDFAPISTVGGFPYAMFVNAKLPVRSVQDLITYARTNKLTYATLDMGGHLAATQFASSANIELTRVPSNASPMADVVAGRIDLYVGPIGPGLADSKAGRVRLLATMTAERMKATPTVPSFGEENIGVPVASLSHQMLLAPAKTPPEVIARLAREVQVAVGTPAVRAELERLSLIPRATSPSQLAREIAETQKVWAQFVREAGLSR